jgi:hypothetical protein
MVEFILNDSRSSETGYKPFELKFGTDAATYFRLPEQIAMMIVAMSIVNFLMKI